jgi:hypothetical protein
VGLNAPCGRSDACGHPAGAPPLEGRMSIRRVVSALLFVTYLPACTSFQATTQPVAELTAPPKSVEKMRVITTKGATIELEYPRVVNDTLYGGPVTSATKAGPVAVPVAEIRTIEVRKSDGGKTAVLIVGIGAVIALLAVAASNINYIGSGFAM